MISVYVVEDEVRILETTIAMVEELGYTVCGSAATIDDAFQGIQKHRPDLVLLDIELGKQNSFDLLSRFPSIDFQVLFITAHQKYALDAFKFSAVDFLLKPLSYSALEAALKRVDELHPAEHMDQLETLQYNLTNTQEDQKIILKTQDKIWILRLNEIVFCESDLSYTIFQTAAERIIVSKTMGYYEGLLVGYGFFRVHKSFLVNVSHVKKIHKSDGGEAELSNGSRVPISQRRKEEFLKIIDSQGLY